MKDITWFEMHDIRKKKFSSDVWIPLVKNQTFIDENHPGECGYLNEFELLHSFCVPISQRESAENTDWNTICSIHQVPFVEDGKYNPCYHYHHLSDQIPWESLVVIQSFGDDSIPYWHFSTDFIIAFNLKREQDKWLAVDEGYIEVAKITRTPQGKPQTFVVKANFLFDYLCAKNMGLMIYSYHHRQENVSDISHISWKKNTQEIQGSDKWEGSLVPMGPNGFEPNAQLGVFSIFRNDANEDDIPVISDEVTNDNSDSQIHVYRNSDRISYYNVTGRFWHKEWIAPGKKSPRIKKDETPSSIFFIVDNQEKMCNSHDLREYFGWLWFSPDVINKLLDFRNSSLTWYTQNTGSISSGCGDSIHFGVNKIGLITVLAEDISYLPDWVQKVWAGFNVYPEGGVAEELFAAQINGIPASTEAPEDLFLKSIEKCNNIFEEIYSKPLINVSSEWRKIYIRMHRFQAINEIGLLKLAKDITRLTADSINRTMLHRLITLSDEEKNLGSLKSLERLISEKTDSKQAHNMLSPLFGVYDLRLADAHLASGKVDAALQNIGVNPESGFIHQGMIMIRQVAFVLTKISNTLEKNK